MSSCRMDDFARLLEVLGREPDERMSVCWTTADHSFRAALTTVREAAVVAARHADGNCWFGTQVLSEQVTRGRGEAVDVVGLRSINCDIDIKPGGMPSMQSAQKVAGTLAEMLGADPAAVVMSGHGVQPHWAIERDEASDWPDSTDPRHAQAVALWRRWGRLVSKVAHAHGGHADSVFDLSRVMRTPGTVNRKSEPVPVTVDFPGGAAVSLACIAEACDMYGVVELPEDREVLGDVIAPSGDWAFGKQTCNYVRAMVHGWSTDGADARHPWFFAQAIRLAGAHRLGCITAEDYAEAAAALTDRFRELLRTGKPVRDEALTEVDDVFRDAVAKVETFSEQRTREDMATRDKPHRPHSEPVERRASADPFDVFDLGLPRQRDEGAGASPGEEGTGGAEDRKGTDAPPGDDTKGTESGPGASESASEASWAPIDLSAFLDGSYEPVEPTLLRRTDGVALLYPGLTHSFHGESESGKSLLLQIEAAGLIAAGQDVLFIDFESDAESVSKRLLTFGALPEDVLKHFFYVRPQSAPDANADEKEAWRSLLERRFTLAVIDGVTDALTTFNYKTKENDDITLWMRRFPRRLADYTGAAVALVDHVTKDGDTRGRFALGGQAKMNALTGAAYTVDIVHPLGKGLRGVVVLRVGKDRPGRVRVHCGPLRAKDRTQEAARIVVDSRDAVPIVTVEPPRDLMAGSDGTGGGGKLWRPTVIMQRLSEIVEAQPGVTQNKLLAQVTGKRATDKTDALLVLVGEGFMTRENGANKSLSYTSLRPYRRALDPLDDDYPGAGSTQGSDPVVPGSRPNTGGRGTTTQATPGNTWEPPGTTQAQRGDDQGECAHCHRLTTIYGEQADKLCSPCRAKHQGAPA